VYLKKENMHRLLSINSSDYSQGATRYYDPIGPTTFHNTYLTIYVDISERDKLKNP